MRDRASAPLRLALLVALGALLFPSAASALTFKIDNQSGQAASNVFVTVAGSASSHDVPGMGNNVPTTLNKISGQKITINKLVSGRIYISYGKGVGVSVPFNSPTRFDWAELTVIPSSSDVANLTAVDQLGIGMRLNTFDGSNKKLEEVGSANSDTVFDAMQDIPGGKARPRKMARGTSSACSRRTRRLPTPNSAST